MLLTKEKKKLQEAINSVLNQNYKPIELIIVNNNSYSIKMKKKLSGINIKVFNCFKNFKSANGRNIGANFANGSHLAFLDDDDVWDQNYLKTIHNAYKKNKRDVFVSKLYFYNKKKIYRNFIMESYEKTLNKIFLLNPGFATSNVLIDKKIFNKVGGYDDNSIPAEDRALLIELILSKAKICSTDAKVFYRLNEKYKSLSTNYRATLKGHSYILEKYKKIMSFKNKLFTRYKIYRARYEVSESVYGLIYLILGLINLIIYNIIK